MTWAFMIIAWGGCICYIPVNIMIPSTGCILGPFSKLHFHWSRYLESDWPQKMRVLWKRFSVGAHLTHSMNSYIPIIGEWPQNDLEWPLTLYLTFWTLDKIESVDNMKRRKSTNIPEKTIGGLSQWFPLAFLLMVAYARSSLIRLSSFISRQSRYGYKRRLRGKVYGPWKIRFWWYIFLKWAVYFWKEA